MGKSPSIQDLEARDSEFATYLDSVRAELNPRADAMDRSLGNQITAWKAQVADAKILITGRNLDFVHEFSGFDTLLNTVQAITHAVFAGTEAPPGTTADPIARKEVGEALGSADEKTAAIELLVAGKVFDLLGTIVYDFGASPAGGFSNSITSQYLDLGMRIFVGIGEQTSASESFFNGKTIYCYVYTYQVLYSLRELQQVTEQTIMRGLANRITEFEHKMAGLAIPDDPQGDQGDRYDALLTWYRRHIEAARAQLDAMEH